MEHQTSNSNAKAIVLPSLLGWTMPTVTTAQDVQTGDSNTIAFYRTACKRHLKLVTLLRQHFSSVEISL